MQDFIDFIFFEVWCQAPSQIRYSFDLYNSKPELKEVLTAFHYSSTKEGDFFNAKIEEIFLIFKMLTTHEINKLAIWYKSNNDIECLCRNDPAVIPSTYEDVNQLDRNLGAALKAFYSRLYSKELLSMKALSDKIGCINDHYKQFVKINRKGKCPFCGLSNIDGEYDHTREAYDHYFPKSKYPFSSINFRNLAPICNKCNSGYKLQKDPIHDVNGNNRKSFYAYNSIQYAINIEVSINTPDLENLNPHDISIDLGPVSMSEELKTWDDLFGIEERYKAHCCSAEAWYWITQIFDECGDSTPAEFLSVRLESAAKSPYADTNFLRKPFLEACKKQNVFKIQ